MSNLQELVYKQGQAGVTRATVTIVFDNADPTQTPVGYEQYDQITITRQIVIVRFPLSSFLSVAVHLLFLLKIHRVEETNI